MAKSRRARDFEAENGKSNPTPPRVLKMHAPGASNTLFDYVEPTEPVASAQSIQDLEPRTPEPEIRIDGTPLGTRGGDLASTALQNIMNSFNAASRKGGVDNIMGAVVDDRFSEGYGGRSASLPHEVADFMDGKARGASLADKDPLDPNKPSIHDEDLDILNNSDVKRASGWDEEMIAEDKVRLKAWLLKEYGAKPKQKDAPPSDVPKAMGKDRAKLVRRMRRLEKEAKQIATGEVKWFVPIPPSDEEPPTPEELDIARQYEQEAGEA